MASLWESYNDYAKQQHLVRFTANLTHIPPAIIFTALLTFILFLLVKGIGSMVVSLLLLYVYPAYMTFKALRVGKPEILLRFGKYWVVLGFMAFIYNFTEWLLLSIPFFGIVKCLFGYLLIRNNGAGAVYMYDTILMPILVKYEAFLDEKLEEVQTEVERGKKEISDVKDKAMAGLREKAK